MLVQVEPANTNLIPLSLLLPLAYSILATSLWARISLYSAQHSWPGLASTSATGTEFHSTSSLSSRAQSLGTTVHLADVHYFVVSAFSSLCRLKSTCLR